MELIAFHETKKIEKVFNKALVCTSFCWRYDLTSQEVSKEWARDLYDRMVGTLYLDEVGRTAKVKLLPNWWIEILLI